MFLSKEGASSCQLIIFLDEIVGSYPHVPFRYASMMFGVIFGLALWFLNPGFFCLLALQASCVICIWFFLEVQYLQHTRLVSSLTRLSTASCLISGVMAWWGLGSFAGLDFTWNIRSWWGWPCCYLDWMLYQQPLWSNIHVWLLWHCPGGCLRLHV